MEYVAAHPICAEQKTPAGLLQPLPFTLRLWSDIYLDFATDLPTSEGNTVILTVVDTFSRIATFIPLAKLPSTKETAGFLYSWIS